MIVLPESVFFVGDFGTKTIISPICRQFKEEHVSLFLLMIAMSPVWRLGIILSLTTTKKGLSKFEYTLIPITITIINDNRNITKYRMIGFFDFNNKIIKKNLFNKPYNYNYSILFYFHSF